MTEHPAGDLEPSRQGLRWRRRAAVPLAQLSADNGIRPEQLEQIMRDVRQCASLHTLLAPLPPFDQGLLLMVLVHGMSHAQIARQTGLSGATVRRRLFKALTALAGDA